MSRLLVLALALTACQQSRPADPLPEIPAPDLAFATVAGRVLDGNELPLEGVTVTCSETDEAYTTGADGQFVLKVSAGNTFTLRTYKPLVHQHLPEITETLSFAGARDLALHFVPVSAPLTRGIFATSFARVDASVSREQLDELYRTLSTHPMVKVVL